MYATAATWHIIHAFVEIVALKGNNKFICLSQTQQNFIIYFLRSVSPCIIVQFK